MSQKHTILITGASSGIGFDSARTLARRGHIVYAAARRLEKMEALKADGVTPIQLDVTKEKDIQNALETIRESHPGVDVLINNAGYGLYGAMEDTSLEDARYQFDVNLFGLARLTQLVIPHMREQNFGRIINTSSVGGKIYTPLGSWYHATKHALEGWSDCLRLEVAPFGIDVVIIEPGAIVTEFGDVMAGPMLKRSGSGPYAFMAQNMASTLEREMNNGGGSHPGVISKLMIKAIEASNPKTRYADGKWARLLLFMRHWLSDRAFDGIIKRMIR
ncbi:MAG: short-chain dehydrogenase/reductase [Verrucomicrobiales bacterium]|jgi:short-subunit dehydrogenase|nr:short-chain dehydrogenase/reductase [Verrucomicrobiales bacterium]|tara:strand:+ start:3600 stop:4424 length:825 start_codon:yes stop_codon:yes gene_type:complete